jgi:hypothetical protein
LPWEYGLDSRRRQAILRSVEDLAKYLHLLFPCRDEYNAGGVVYYRVSEGYSLGRRLRGILQVCDPTVFFGQQLMPGEERRGVPVRTHSEEDQVEHWEARGIFLGEFMNELLLVRVGKLFEVVEQRDVEDMDVMRGDGYFGKEEIGTRKMIGIGVIERHDAFVGVEDVPMHPSSENRAMEINSERLTTCPI